MSSLFHWRSTSETLKVGLFLHRMSGCPGAQETQETLALPCTHTHTFIHRLDVIGKAVDMIFDVQVICLRNILVRVSNIPL